MKEITPLSTEESLEQAAKEAMDETRASQEAARKTATVAAPTPSTPPTPEAAEAPTGHEIRPVPASIYERKTDPEVRFENENDYIYRLPLSAYLVAGFYLQIPLFFAYTYLLIFITQAGNSGGFFSSFTSPSFDASTLSIPAGALIVGICILSGQNALRYVALLILTGYALYSGYWLFQLTQSGLMRFGASTYTLWLSGPIIIVIITIIIMTRRKVRDAYQ